MKKYFSILLCGLLYAVSLNAEEPKPPVIIGKEHALSEKMLSPQIKKSKLSLFQKNKSPFVTGETFDLGDGMSMVCDKNDLTGTLLEVRVTAEQYSELISEIYFIPRLKEITNLVYSKLNDDFDFVFFVLNTPIDDVIKNQLGFYGLNMRVSNSVQGLGAGKHDFTAEWGSGGKLISALYFPYYDAIAAGPSLHELLHSWSSFICPTYDLGKKQYLAHWGISNANGQAGGFQNVRIVEENCDGVAGKTLYQASRDSKTQRNGSFKYGGFGVNGNDGNGLPYSDIELYLMGLKSAQEMRDANFHLDIYSGNDYQTESFANGYFYSTAKKTYTIDDIIARNGKRLPDASESQKKFKILTVVLTPDVATENFRNVIMRDINWLAGEMNDASYPNLFNFRQATGNRGSLIVNDLMSSLKTPVARTASGNSSDNEATSENILIAESKKASGSDYALPDAIVYPNPTDGIFTIEFDAKAYNITLSDANGKILLRRNVAARTIQLDLKEYPSGMYLLTIESDLQKITKKIVKN